MMGQSLINKINNKIGYFLVIHINFVYYRIIFVTYLIDYTAIDRKGIRIQILLIKRHLGSKIEIIE